ncbi:MAG TPA: pirin-like C-terminal cupin domain-containing protein, partial [Burkholderiales bacterium]
RYQELTTKTIPEVALPEDGGKVRVIAGEYAGTKGPADTFTPVNVFDVRLRAGRKLTLDLRDGYSAAFYILGGSVRLNGAEDAAQTELVVFERSGAEVTIEALSDATVFVMSGEPLEEPVYGYGPFVMNTPKEIEQAFVDFRLGRFGTVPEETA